MAGKNVSGNVGMRDKRDQERVESMANEGGTAGAHMDTREQMEASTRGRLRKRRVIPWSLGAAAASVALGGVALARTLLGKRRLRTAGSEEIEVEIESGGRAEPARKRAQSGRRGTRQRAAGGRSTTKRTRARSNAGARKASVGRQRTSAR